jgi:Zn-finger nucleic acid-binding protein
MRCPIDGTELKMADRQGVEIDYCPQCRGVWLDRGELDKIIERAATILPAAPMARPEDAPRPTEYPRPEQYQSRPGYEAPRRYEDRDRYDDDDDRYDDDRYGRKRKRRSFLDDIFDFD